MSHFKSRKRQTFSFVIANIAGCGYSGVMGLHVTRLGANSVVVGAVDSSIQGKHEILRAMHHLMMT
jgi:hypothetical protein